MRFIAGGIQVSTESTGRTLLVLPVQFNRCFAVNVLDGDREARLIRVNVFQTGLLFDRSVELEARYDDGGLAARCAAAEQEDAERLGLAALATPRRLPEWTHPGLSARWRFFEGTRWSGITVPTPR